MSVKQWMSALQKDERSATTSDSEHTPWENVLLQITLPITLILAFVAITKLSEAMARYKQKEEALERILGVYRGTSFQEMVDQKNEIIIELQKQKVIRALDHLRHSEGLQSGLFVFPNEQSHENNSANKLTPISAQAVTLRKWRISDKNWQTRFEIIAATYSSRRRENQTIFAYYKKLLQLTGDDNRPPLDDPLIHNRNLNWSTFMNGMKAALNHDPGVGIPKSVHEINAEIRLYAWKELEKFSAEIKDTTITLQLGIIQRITEYFVTHPEAVQEIHIPRRQAKTFRLFLEKPEQFSKEETRRLMLDLAAAIEDFIRNQLEADQYDFLDEVWQFS